MIDPKDLEGFNTQLEELVGAKFRDSHLFTNSVRIQRFVVVFIKQKDGTENSIYKLEIADCAWQLILGNSLIFTCLPKLDSAPKGQKILEKLADARVSSYYFNVDDLSLLISLDNGFSLKLLQSKESDWQYSYVINGYGIFYHTYNDTLGWGCIDYQ